MTKNLILFLILIIAISAKGQQEAVFRSVLFQDIDDLNVINNGAMINPTFLPDTNKLVVKYNTYAQGLGGSWQTKNAIAVQAKLSSVSLGLNFDSKKIGLSTSRWYTSSIKRNWKLNQKSGIDVGANLGIIHYRYPTPPIYSYGIEQSFFVPVVDFGFRYQLNKHTIGISYKSISTAFINYEDVKNSYYIQKPELIASYQNSFNLFNRFYIAPELYGFFQKDSPLRLMAALNVDYLHKVKIGMLYNTRDITTFHLTGIINKRFNIGYSYSVNNLLNGSDSYGMHNLNLGFIL